VKVRQDERIVSVAVIVAVGVNADGRREVDRSGPDAESAY
jgi:transposase-like protein